jgi:hypothetical protein
VELKNCPECGVPESITREHLWLNNGDIVHNRAQENRLVFMETENLEPLFKGIEEIIGTAIEPMIIAAGRRANRAYLGALLDSETKERIRNKELEYRPVMESFFALARSLGVGSYQFLDFRYERDDSDYNTVRISEPFCIPMNVSAHLGDIELLTGVDYGYTYVQVSPGECNIHVFPSPHPEGLSKRMWTKPYEHREGNIELERCGTCAGPKLLGGCQWFPNRGVIANRNTRRRMAIQGNALLDPVFEELEAELGDTIPRTVVEAQRRFTKSGFYTMDDITDEGDFRTQLALRGLGNLKQLDMRRKGLFMRVENVALPLLVIGQAQGFFEMGFDIDSTDVDWEISEEGDLEMQVKPPVIQEANPGTPVLQEAEALDPDSD